MVLYVIVAAAIYSPALTQSSFHYTALNDEETTKYVVDSTELGRWRRDLASIHQQPPLLRQFQKKNLMRIDTYELDNQKKRQLIAQAQQHTLTSALEKEDDLDKSKTMCSYYSVSSRIGECFEKHHDCK